MKIWVTRSVLVWCLFSCAGAIGQVDRWQVVASVGDPAPGVPGAVFASISSAAINESGTIALTATIEGPGVNDANRAGIWIGPAGGLTLVLRAGAEILPGVQLLSTAGASLNNAGVFASRVLLQGAGVTPDDDEAVLRIENGVPAIVIRKDGVIAGLQRYGEISSRSVQINDFGEIAFQAEITDAGPVIDGYFVRQDPFTFAIAREGNPAPGTPDAFSSLDGSSSALRNVAGGSVVLRANIDVPGGSSGLWVRDNGVLSKIAIGGEQTPFGVGSAYFSFDAASVDALGRAVFRASYSFGAVFRSAIFRFENGTISALLGSDDPAPGFPSGTTFGSIGMVPTLNPQGRMAFQASVVGPSIFPPANRAVFIQNAVGAFRPIATQGLELPQDLAPGRTVSFFTFGNQGSFVRRNLMLLRATFDDGGAALLLAETGIPVVEIRGKKRRVVRKKRFVLRGTASDDEPLVVQIKPGKKRWVFARGSTNWRRPIRLRTQGKRKRAVTRVQVRATDIDGNVSDIKQVRVVFRPRR